VGRRRGSRGSMWPVDPQDEWSLVREDKTSRLDKYLQYSIVENALELL